MQYVLENNYKKIKQCNFLPLILQIIILQLKKGYIGWKKYFKIRNAFTYLILMFLLLSNKIIRLIPSQIFFGNFCIECLFIEKSNYVGLPTLTHVKKMSCRVTYLFAINASNRRLLLCISG